MNHMKKTKSHQMTKTTRKIQKKEREEDDDAVQKDEVEGETKADTTEGEGGPTDSGENQVDSTEQGERDDIGPLTFYQNDQKFGNTMEALKAQREEGKFCDTILLAGTNEFKVCNNHSRPDCYCEKKKHTL